ncbi:MAG: helix-turn-helix domain-containing protein [Verrucomicrobia bacterium]|nr:helix-turn-helix domain-containing protein [Verrucomicrobiota bacterium]MCH8526589.1 helix-turn-helix domain-containing protein [Kiritimatiellia bacterium]
MDSFFALYRPYNMNAGSEQVLNQVALGVYDQAVESNCPCFIQDIRDLGGLRYAAGAIALLWSEERLEAFQSHGIPVVNVSNTRGAIAGAANVLSDDRAVGKMAAEHLLERKYEHLITVGYKGRTWSDQRLEGFQKALKNRPESLTVVNLELDRKKSPCGPSAYAEQIWEQLAPELEAHPPATGIFTASDWLAWPMMEMMRRHCPDRIYTSGILGVDNLHDSLFDPRRTAGLSSILPGFRTAGSIGLSLLMDAAQQKKNISRISKKIPPERLIRRASTAGDACADPVIGKVTRELWGCLRRGHAISLRKIAKDNQIGLRSLEMRFETGVGVPARTLLADMRVQLGKELLTETNLPVADVSNRCGYANTTTFSNTFRKAVGMTPRDWRKQYQHPFAHSNRTVRMF